MDEARISELLAPFLSSPADDLAEGLGEGPGKDTGQDLGKDPGAGNLIFYISTYIDILLRWNSRINLTAIRDPEEIVTRHFGESLFAARHLFPNNTHQPTTPATKMTHVGTAAPGCPAEQSSAVADTTTNVRASQSKSEAGHVNGEDRLGRSRDIANHHEPTKATATLADVGSGAGFPGIPIKLWAPDISLTLIESNQKKATFLREVTRALTLTHVDIQNTRAESLPQASFDIVTLRAVERFDRALPIAANLVAPNGRLALLIGKSQLESIDRSLPTFSQSDPFPVPHSESRIFVIAHRKS